MNKKISWTESAWEELLQKVWDGNTEKEVVEYSKADLDPILIKYTKSGQGEIRIFNSTSGNIAALQRRGVAKLPLSRSRWILFKSPPKIIFTEPEEGGLFKTSKKLTDGMIAGIRETLSSRANPGETTMLAIAKQAGIISDFYSLSSEGVMFTGGRQKAGIKIHIGEKVVDMSSAQIEIDGGYEWPNDVVIVEMKSKFKQPAFDTNQAIIPMLKWKFKLKDKNVCSLVLLAETNATGIEYWAYDIICGSSEVEGTISKCKKYIIKI